MLSRHMRFWLAILCLWAAIAPAAPGATGAATLNGLPRYSLFGREYVNVAAWAKAAGFEWEWTRPREELQIASKYSRVILTMDSRKATINGATVWLSAPIARKDDEAFIGPVDLRTAIFPVLYPPKLRQGTKIRTVCLDPGHGGKDPGNEEGVLQEKKYTLLLANELQAVLKKAGLKVVSTRTSDTFVDLAQRPETARAKGAQLLVSLHFNSAQGGGAKGLETYCMTPAHTSSSNARGEGAETGPRAGNRSDAFNLLLAFHVHKAMAGSTLRMEDRGIKRARFAVLNTATLPAILIEGGFMDNAEDRQKILDAAARKKLARAIADGILAYKKQGER
jgi:N-acetylmuramoyl-L-alanine amidase